MMIWGFLDLGFENKSGLISLIPEGLSGTGLGLEFPFI